MKIGEAVKIFKDIENEQYTVEEKGTAIMHVCRMPTHNSIKKDLILKALWWLLNLAFELPEESNE